MARFRRVDIISVIESTRLIPVFYSSDIEICKNVITACYEGGVRVFEFTNRGDYAHEVFSRLNKWSAVVYPDLVLGVGSVIDAPTAALYIQLGANFIVSPLLNADTARVCNRRKILWCPGCTTVSEISSAEELGAEIVKIFPGSVVGPEFVKAVKGPMPWSSIMPTGGVEPTRESLTTWFSAGVTCVGMGSNLITKKAIQQGLWKEITNTVKECLSIITEIKNK